MVKKKSNKKEVVKKDSNKKILVVDDEKDIRETVKLLLEDEGYNVVTARDGATCLKQVKKHNPDLIVLDIIMPGLSTKNILTKLDLLHKDIPIVFLTVVRLSEATKEDLFGNIADYIEKPFNNKDLIKRIKKALK